MIISGADPGFQVRGAHLKKLGRAEGGANIFGEFRVKILGGGAGWASPPPPGLPLLLKLACKLIFQKISTLYEYRKSENFGHGFILAYFGP